MATQPNINFTINKLAQFLTNPSRIHLQATLCVLRYLKGTKIWHLNLSGEIADLAGFSDSDWGGDHNDRKSVSAYVFQMGDGAISWKTKKQSSVVLSSVEAEYMVMCQVAKEAIWLTGFLKDLGIHLHSTLVIFGDNQGALALAHNPVFHPHSKLIAIQYHYTRELIQNGCITIKYLPTKVMIADTLTKSLAHPQHMVLTEMLGVYEKREYKFGANDERGCYGYFCPMPQKHGQTRLKFNAWSTKTMSRTLILAYKVIVTLNREKASLDSCLGMACKVVEQLTAGLLVMAVADCDIYLTLLHLCPHVCILCACQQHQHQHQHQHPPLCPHLCLRLQLGLGACRVPVRPALALCSAKVPPNDQQLTGLPVMSVLEYVVNM